MLELTCLWRKCKIETVPDYGANEGEGSFSSGKSFVCRLHDETESKTVRRWAKLMRRFIMSITFWEIYLTHLKLLSEREQWHRDQILYWNSIQHNIGRKEMENRCDQMSPTALNNKHSSSAFKIVIPFLEFFINGILVRSYGSLVWENKSLNQNFDCITGEELMHRSNMCKTLLVLCGQMSWHQWHAGAMFGSCHWLLQSF